MSIGVTTVDEDARLGGVTFRMRGTCDGFCRKFGGTMSNGSMSELLESKFTILESCTCFVCIPEGPAMGDGDGSLEVVVVIVAEK